MYLISLTKGERIETYLIEVKPNKDYIQNIIEYEFIQTAKEAGDYYTDREKYMENIAITEEYLEFPNLYVLYTGVSGWDTYDSGVFSAWTEDRARELAERKSKDFRGASVELIGIYNSTKEEEICCSFNAG